VGLPEYQSTQLEENCHWFKIQSDERYGEVAGKVD
jgi:hypothetical protein